MLLLVMPYVIRSKRVRELKLDSLDSSCSKGSSI